jgi:cytochrome c oxidase subunit III
MIAPPGERAAQVELEISLAENDTNGGGSRGPAVPADPPRNISELDPDRTATPASAARLFTCFAMFWIVALFGTIAVVLESRWAHSANWFSIPLPRALYASTVLLLVSSAAMEFARRSLRSSAGIADARRATRWLFGTALIGAAFLGSQMFAWQQFAVEGPRVASNPGSFFFYLITGAHGALLLVGLVFLASAAVRIAGSRASANRASTLGTIALYWHFLDFLWLCLFALLLTAVA